MGQDPGGRRREEVVPSGDYPRSASVNAAAAERPTPI